MSELQEIKMILMGISSRLEREESPDAAAKLAIEHEQDSDPRSEWAEPEKLMDCHLEWAPDLNHDCYLAEEVELCKSIGSRGSVGCALRASGSVSSTRECRWRFGHRWRTRFAAGG